MRDMKDGVAWAEGLGMTKGGEVVLWCRREDRGGELPVESRERWCSHFETKPADSTTEECHSHCFPPNGQQFSTGRRNHASAFPIPDSRKATNIDVSIPLHRYSRHPMRNTHSLHQYTTKSDIPSHVPL